jgi:prepilin-type N-terminal cleavage/methylation domain-containing protein
MCSKQINVRRRRGFTLLELQVAIILLAFGFVTLASLMATQTRLLKRLERGFGPGSTIYVTQSKDPWVKKLAPPARLTTAAVNETAPAAGPPGNTVSIVSQQQDLKNETMTVTADASPID